MRRLRPLHVLLAVLTGALAFAAAAAGQGTLSLTEAGGCTFPDRCNVLTLPVPTPLRASQVTVTENGDPVQDLAIVPADAAERGQFGTALVIDTSNSMKGDPIVGAMEAAHAFAARRGLNQQLSVVTFNSNPRIALGFTADQAAIDAALASTPVLELGTHIYDAVDAALLLIQKAGLASGSIVVLSDGADTGSSAGITEIAAAARAAHVRIFTVGLASEQFKPDRLEQLAADSGGTYSEAGSAADLKRIYAELGSQFASEYLIKYRSLVGPATKVNVEVTVKGVSGVATAIYVTPQIAPGKAGTYRRSAAYRFWRSGVAVIVFAIFAASLVGIAFAAITKPHRQTLVQRLGEFVPVSLPKKSKKQGAGIADRVFIGAERSFEKTRWWGRFKEQLEIANIRFAAVQIVFFTMVLTVFVGWALTLAVGTPLVSPIALFAPVFVWNLIQRKLMRVRRTFSDQLPDNLEVLASAMRAGHSFVGALSVVVDDAAEPARSEFRQVVADEQLGVPLEHGLDVVARRMNSRDLEQISLVAALQRQTGGNTAEVLDRAAETIRERAEVRRLVRTLTAQGRMARWIVSGLPIFLLVVITILSPDYVSPLYEKTAGRILLAVASALVIAGSLVIKKIINIKI